MGPHEHHHKIESAPEEIAYCVLCGGEMVTRQVSDKRRRVCSRCGHIHFTDPKVGVGVMVVKDGKLLLVRRRMNPERGKWSIPAGFLDRGEDPKVTAQREALEETGLHVSIDSVSDVYYNPPGQGASIFILYQASLLGGKMKAGDDAEAVGFFGLDELPELAFASTRDAIKKLQSLNQAHREGEVS